MFRKKIISGCEARGDAGQPYLTRWTLWSTSLFQVLLHVFHRSDHDDLHDHPWPFVSFILWRGYYEVTAEPTGRRYKRMWPGMLLFRSATHAHKVELIGGKPAVTLVVTGKRIRAWGFFTAEGWKEFRQYFRENGC